MDQFTAQYHLPGLFEFYALYRLLLPLFFEHREYFYDWCGIGSIYGAPEGCLWGGGRVSCGDCDPRDALALLRDYGISARLTFSNSLLRPEHLADPRCNALCRLFESSGENGIIVHSDLLVDHLRQHYPGLYLVSSTTKVLTDFSAFRQELARPEFRYVVPDFRLNPALEQLRALSPQEKAKVEFLCNECCRFGCPDRRACYEAVAARTSASPDRSTAAPRRTPRRATASPEQWKIPASSASATSAIRVCRWAFPSSSSRAAASAARWCWSFSCIT